MLGALRADPVGDTALNERLPTAIESLA